jgi:urease accessory protein
MQPLALLRLLQLVSPALPIGGYNFSQALEYAIEAGWVRDEASALEWIRGLAGASMGTLDVPVLFRLHAAWSAHDAAGVERERSERRCAESENNEFDRGDAGRAECRNAPPGDIEAVTRWSRFLIASRETSELRAEDRHLGRSLAKVLAEAGLADARAWITRPDATFVTLFTLGCVRWNVGANECAWGYLWTWAENQVLAAVKAVPLGQSAGQRLLDALIQQIPSIVAKGAALEDEHIGSAAPLHLIASAAHETQYTRLFRS